jgi:HK97 family phage portal protein
MPDETGGIVVRDMRGRRRVELRDPSAATGNLGFRARGMPMVAEWDAGSALQWAYYANTIVYRCVQVTANALSRVPFRVGADPTKPKDFDPKAPLARLLGPAPYGPNRETSARQLWAWTVAQYLVTGRFAWENELDDGRPVALWPLPSSSLQAIPSSGGALYFERFEFGPPSKRRPLRAEQVTYGWRPSAQDWRQPESALQAARMDISVAVMQDRYDYAFLKNGARPDFLLVHESFTEPDEEDAFRAQFLAEHRGPDNAGKPAFVGAESTGDKGVSGAIDVKQLGLSQKDAESIRRYEQKVRQICLALGTPLSKLGDASGRTFNNAGQEDINWYGETVQPLGDELADVVNIKLAPMLGDNVGWFDWTVVKALQPEPKVTAVGVPALVAAKVATINEGRGLIELPGIGPEGDLLGEEQPAPDLQAAAAAFATLVQNGVTFDSAAAATGWDGLAPSPGKIPAQETPADRAVGQQTRDAEPAPDREALALERRDSRWKVVNSRAETLEKTWQRSMTRLFTRQQQATLARLGGKRGRQMLTAALEARAPEDPAPQVDPTDIFDPEFWTDETRDTAAGLYEQVVTVAGTEVAERFGIAFDLDAAYVADFIQARAHDLAGQVTQTTYDQIRAALVQGVADGLGIDDLADAVKHVFAVASDSRATMIARTEVISAYNGAATLQAAQLPEDVVAGKEWVATRDPRTREAHSEADGQTVSIRDAFDVGGETVEYPGDGSAENSINCRCTVAFLTPDEMPDERARRVDERLARAAFRLVQTGLLEPDEVETRMRASA